MIWNLFTLDSAIMHVGYLDLKSLLCFFAFASMLDTVICIFIVLFSSGILPSPHA